MGLKNLPKHSPEYRLEVIMRRHENHSTIMTSNRPIEEWAGCWATSAILNRFLHHAQVIAITGRSYRLKDQPLAGREEKKKPAKANEPSTAEPAS